MGWGKGAQLFDVGLMTLKQYGRVALTRDIPTEGLRRGDIAYLLERLPHPHGGGPGCVLEVFNALGESLLVVAVPESAVEALRSNEVLAVRTYS